MQYFVLDVETCPIQLEGYESLPEEEQKKMLNPIDSKVIAIGLRHENTDIIFLEENEKILLQKFWNAWASLRQGGRMIVGFNITQFDIPFLIARSFINNVPVVPFTLKYVLDLREKINAYRSGHSRGTLKDFGRAMGLKDLGMDGSAIAGLCRNKEYETIKRYLMHDLLITDEMFKRMKDLKITEIERY